MIKFVKVTKIYDGKDIVDSMRKRVIAIENGTIIKDEIRGTYDYEY